MEDIVEAWLEAGDQVVGLEELHGSHEVARQRLVVLIPSQFVVMGVAARGLDKIDHQLRYLLVAGFEFLEIQDSLAADRQTKGRLSPTRGIELFRDEAFALLQAVIRFGLQIVIQPLPGALIGIIDLHKQIYHLLAGERLHMLLELKFAHVRIG